MFMTFTDMVHDEVGRDTGGVTRELWCLFGCAVMQLCEGQPDKLVLRHNSEHVQVIIIAKCMQSTVFDEIFSFTYYTEWRF